MTKNKMFLSLAGLILVALLNVAASPKPEPEIKLLFSGQIVPGRCVQAGVDKIGNADYIYSNIRSIIQNADLAIGTLNGSMSNECTPIGCIDTSILLNGRPEHAAAMERAGFDGMSVATNHINNCSTTNAGFRPFQDTLSYLKKANIQPIGGGNNLEEALKPVVFVVKGVRFAIISLGEIEKNVFAGENHPGTAPLTDSNLYKAILAARKVADVVIFMPHWGPEYNPIPNPGQMRYARLALDWGADLVVGNHPHVIQAIKPLNGGGKTVPVFYGLGNFVFDQSWDLRLKSSLLLEITFEGSHYQGYRIIPLVTAKNGTVSIATGENAAQILRNLETATRKTKP